jgi:5,10-methylenetetrahydrofolate reductase
VSFDEGLEPLELLGLRRMTWEGERMVSPTAPAAPPGAKRSRSSSASASSTGWRRWPFAIGGACFPETHIHAVSPEQDLEHLAEKVAAGVQFLITQLFFDNALRGRYLTG